MIAVIFAVQLAWWTTVIVGFVASVTVLALVVPAWGTVRRTILLPRREGRRWPEGSGWGALEVPPAATVRSLVREDLLSARSDRRQADAAVAVSLGVAVAALLTVPVSPAAVVADPALGVFVLPLCATLAVVADAWGASGVGPTWWRRPRLRVRGAGVVALWVSALAIAATWGSASLLDVVAAQAHAQVAGFDGWGLPSALVQPLGCGAALLALHLLASDGDQALVGVDVASGLRVLLSRVAEVALLAAGAGWVVTTYLGGAAVPWAVTDSGARTALGGALLLLKLIVVLVGLSWSTSRFPHVGAVAAERRVFIGVVPATLLGVAATLAVRAWV